MSLSRPAEGCTVSLQALITRSIAGRGFPGKSLQSLSTTCSISHSCHELLCIGTGNILRDRLAYVLGIGNHLRWGNSERVRRSSRNRLQHRTTLRSATAQRRVLAAERGRSRMRAGGETACSGQRDTLRYRRSIQNVPPCDRIKVYRLFGRVVF